MAFNAGSVVGFLKLDTKGFSDGLKGAEKETKSFSEKFAKNSAKIGKSMALAGVAITGALTAMVLSTAKAGDEMHKMAIKTGISTKALSSYVLATQIGGSNINTFANGMKRLSKNMLDSTRGLETAERGFAELGIKVTDSKGNLRDMESVMLDVADKFKGMENGAKKSALAQDIFGRAGAELIPMLNEGSEGIKRQTEDAEKLGIVFSEKLANKSAELVDEQARLKASFSGVTQTISANLMPIVTSLLQSITKVVSGVTGWMKENPKLSGTLVKITAGVGILLTALAPIVLILPKIITLISARLIPALVRMKVAVLAMNPALTAFAVVAGIATVASKLFLKASEERLKKTIELGNQEGKTMQEVSGFMAQASEAQRKSITERIARLTKMGVSNKEIFRNIHIGLTNNSKAFKDWKDKTGKSIEDANKNLKGNEETVNNVFTDSNGIIAKAVERYKELTMDQFAFRKFQAKKSFDENVALLTKEKAGDEQFLSLKKTFNQELFKIEKDRADKTTAEKEKEWEAVKTMWQEEGELEADRQAKKTEQETINTEKRNTIQGMVKSMLIERQMLRSNDHQQQLLQTKVWYDTQKEALDKNKTDHEQYLDALDVLNKTYDAKRTAIDTTYLSKKTLKWQQWAQFATQILNQLSGIIQGFTNRNIKSIETEYEKKKQFIIDNVEDEDERNKQLQELENELSDKKKKAAKASFLANKASSMASAIVNTATAVTSALKAPFPFNFVLAGIIGAMGAVQVGLIASQKMPALAEGGVTTGATTALIGEGKENEIVLPLSTFFDKVGIGENSDSGGSGKVTNIFNIQAIDGSNLVTIVKERIVPILEEALNDESFLVNPEAVRMV